MFKLTKQKRGNKFSRVPEGYSVTGDLWCLWYDENDMFHRDEFEKLFVMEGSQVLVTRGFGRFLRTSPVSKILKATDDFILFQTQTSVYKLEKVNDKED